MTKSAVAAPDNICNMPPTPTSQKYSASAILQVAAASASASATTSATSVSSAISNTCMAEDQQDKDATSTSNVLNKKKKKNPSLPSASSVLVALQKESSSPHHQKGGRITMVNNSNTNTNTNSTNQYYFQGQRTGLSKSNSFRDLTSCSSSKEAVLRAQKILDNYQSSSCRIRGKVDKTTTSSLLDQSLLDGLDLSISADQGLDYFGTSKHTWGPNQQLQKKTSTSVRLQGSPRRVGSKSAGKNKEEESAPSTTTTSSSSMKRTSSDKQAPRSASPISGRGDLDRSSRHGTSFRKSKSLRNISPRRAPSKSHHKSEDDTESPPPKHKLQVSSEHGKNIKIITSPQSSPSGRDRLDASSRHHTKRSSKAVTKLSPSSTHNHRDGDGDGDGDGEKLGASSSSHDHHRRHHHDDRHHQHQHQHRGVAKKCHNTGVDPKRSSSLSAVRCNSSTHGGKSDNNLLPNRTSRYSRTTKESHRRAKHEDAAASPKRISSRAAHKHCSNRDLDSSSRHHNDHKAQKMNGEQQEQSKNPPQLQPGDDMQDFSASVDIDEENNENNNDLEQNQSNNNNDNNDNMKDFSSTVDIDTQSENSYCSESDNDENYSSDSKDEKNDRETRLAPRRRAAATTKRAISHRGRVGDARGRDAASDVRPSRRRRDGAGKRSAHEVGDGSGSKINESRRRRAERRAAKENSPVRKISGADRTNSNAGVSGRRGHHGRVRNPTSHTIARAANLGHNQLVKAVESTDPAATLALIAGYDRDDKGDLQQPRKEFDGTNNDETSTPPSLKSASSASSAGFLRSVASTSTKTGLNVASTVASKTGLTTVASTVASTKKVAQTGLNAESTVASTTATTGLKALTTFSAAATSAVNTALKHGKDLINGEGAFHIMVEGVAPGQNLAKFIKKMDSGAIDNVKNSWKELQKHGNYEENAGILLFTHLFESCPSAKSLFGFPADADPRSENVRQDPAFTKHAAYFIKMIEKAIGLLTDKGTASLDLQTILFDLGKKLYRMGVEQAYFPFVGQSLVEALREMLGRKRFTPSSEKSWVLVYNVLAAEMCHGMNTDKIVIAAWAQLRTVPCYKEKVSLLIFQYLFQNCPASKELFGFGSDFKLDTNSLKESMHFRMHAEYFIVMFDKVLSMVETHTIDQHMRDLGKKHVRNGMKVEYFPVMGEGLIHALEVLLKQDFNDETREAWISAYARLSSKMISEMRHAS